MNFLTFCIITILVGIIFVCICSYCNLSNNLIKLAGLLTSLIVLFVSLALWINFDNASLDFQFTTRLPWISDFNTDLILGVDGISLWFILLTTFIMPLTFIAIWNLENKVLEFVVCLLLIEFSLILAFSVLDLFIFYIAFESVLIPMFLIVGIWGSRKRKIKAAYYLFLYTLTGSFFMLFAIISINLEIGSTSYDALLNSSFDIEKQKMLWFCFFIAFAVKIPMFPFHIWLPEAHVEAPTVGSVILASLLLKLGGYGLIRFLIPLFPYANKFYGPLVFTLASIGVVYGSLTTIRQIDLKKMIAYSSVAHMNVVVLGIFSLTVQGVCGSILLMVAHGIVSGSLFLMIGIIYDRHHNRMIRYYGGATALMPTYSLIFLIFNLSNLAMPGSSNWVGEALVIVGLFQKNTIIAILGSIGMVYSACYSLWLFGRVCMGTLKIQYISAFSDMNNREIWSLVPMIFYNVVIGIYPAIILDPALTSVDFLLAHSKFYY